MQSSTLEATLLPSEVVPSSPRSDASRPEPDGLRFHQSFSAAATDQIPKLRDGSLVKIAIVGAIAVTLAIVAYLLGSS